MIALFFMELLKNISAAGKNDHHSINVTKSNAKYERLTLTI